MAVFFGAYKPFLAFKSNVRSCQKGFTFVELAVVVGLIAVLSAVVLGNWASSSEVRDASAVQTGQAALQQVISQGSSRADASPSSLLVSQRANIVNATNLLMQNRPELRFSDAPPNFRMTVSSTGRSASFSVDPDGNVTLQALSTSQWTEYVARNGIIARRN